MRRAMIPNGEKVPFRFECFGESEVAQTIITTHLEGFFHVWRLCALLIHVFRGLR